RRARPHARGDARHHDAGRSHDGDARRRVGAELHLSRVAAAGDARRAGAVGRRRARRDDLARHRPVGRRHADARAPRIRRSVLEARRRAISMGRRVGARHVPAGGTADPVLRRSASFLQRNPSFLSGTALEPLPDRRFEEAIMRMLITTGALVLALGGQAFAQTRGPIVVTCGPGQHAVVRDGFVNGAPATRVSCAGTPYVETRYEPRRYVATRSVERAYVERRHRSWGKSALVIGGSAAAGAGIGGPVHGAHGAPIPPP